MDKDLNRTSGGSGGIGLLPGLSHPRDLQRLNADELNELAREIRQRILDVVGRTGGHLASNLGVTELTIALHRCFDFEQDRLLFDVGHQCYPHKLLTGRNAQFDTLRQCGGLSGFPCTAESPFDQFDVGHAGTAIATAVGLARGDEAMGRDNKVVAVVGDASIVNGLSFEGLNQAGTLQRQFLVILNDNNWGIAPTQGAMAQYLARFRTSGIYEEIKSRAKQLLPQVPLIGQSVADVLGHHKQGVKASLGSAHAFEQLGFLYAGPVNGHDIAGLIEMFTMLREVAHPVLLHVHTNKGQGADFARAEPGRFHSPRPFVIENGKATITKGSGKSWTAAFSQALIEAAAEDPRVHALTAAMPDGTGLDQFAKVYPSRYRDIGIAESCAVDVAAGMAKAGLRPVVAIYSTFLQRAFDQIFQEVVLQGLPVVFCMDRAGLVGDDGAVHHGFLDIAFLRGFPNMVVAAPADELELKSLLRFALQHDQAVAIRYPRDNVPEPLGASPEFQLGRSRLMREGRDATILAYGSGVADALAAADLLAEQDVFVRVVNARFAKPLDAAMVREALTAGGPTITVEDHSTTGGFGSAVLECAQELGLSAAGVVRLGIPADRFIRQGTRPGQLAECGIDPVGIAAAASEALGRRTPRTGELRTANRELHVEK